MSRNLGGAGISLLCISALFLASSLVGVPVGDSGVVDGTGLDSSITIQSNDSATSNGVNSGQGQRGTGNGSGDKLGNASGRNATGEGQGRGQQSGENADTDRINDTSGKSETGGEGTNATGKEESSKRSDGGSDSDRRSQRSLIDDTETEASTPGNPVGNRTTLGGPITPGKPQVTFTVDANAGAYWRVKAYDRYTGSAWRREVAARPNGGSTPSETLSLGQSITAERPLAWKALPAAWRVEQMDDGTSYGTVMDQGYLRADQGLESGETYTVTSRVPLPDPNRLDQVGSNDPDELKAHYTRLPDSVPDRVGHLSADITADAETRYERAAAIERWLERNKRYSLAAPRPESNFVDTFLFELERGYCQYYAASMVVMLRTQDVPARYVTGYSAGQRDGDGQYIVRSMNAHAWVEVYFPGEGWVQFDPTPSTNRTQSERSTLESARAEGIANVDIPGSQGQSYTPAPRGSPSERAETQGLESETDSQRETSDDRGDESGDETDRDSGSQQADDTQSDDSTRQDDTDDSTEQTDSDQENADGEETDQGEQSEETPPPPYNLSVSGSPIPGTNVTIEVTQGGDPASGVPVFFTDESIGRTNETGRMTARIPYRSELVISVPSAADSDQTAETDTHSRLDGGIVSPRPRSRHRFLFASINPAPGGFPALAQRETPESDDTVRLDIETTITVRPLQSAVPGKQMRLQADIRNQSVAKAPVWVNGEPAGVTRANGTVDVAVPYAESLNVTVTRGDANGSRRLQTPPLKLDVGASRTPEESVRVVATVANTTVPNASVALGRTRVGQTNVSGAASVRLPYRPTATITVARGELAASRNLDLPDELNVTTEGLVFPGQSVVVSTSVDGTTVPRANVSAGGRLLGTTDASGRLNVTLPLQNTYQITVIRGELRGTTTVSGILVIPAAGALLVVALVGLAATNRYVGVGPSPGRLLGRVRRAVSDGWQTVISGVIGVAALVAGGLERLIAFARALTTETMATVRATPGRVARLCGRLARAVTDRARGAWRWMHLRGRRWVTALGATSPRDIVSWLLAVLRGRMRRSDGATTQPGDSTGAGSHSTVRGPTALRGDNGGAGETDPRIDVRQAWDEVTAAVHVSNPATATAVQYRERAVADGRPVEAVRTLTDLYRKVEYSHRQQTVTDQRRAWEALQAFKTERRGDADG